MFYEKLPAIEVYKWILVGVKRGKRHKAEMDKLKEESGDGG